MRNVAGGFRQKQAAPGYNETNLSRLLISVFGACAAIGIAAETAPFAKTVYPVFEEAGCRGCHNPDGVASATRLQFPEQGAPAERIEAFGKSLVLLVDHQNPANSLLLRKPTARLAHAGGQRIQPDSPEETVLRAWIDRLVQLKGDELAAALRYRDQEASGAGATRPRIVLRRLTHSQYNNTVRDLLGDRSMPANRFPPEDFVNGFKNQYASQNLSPLLEDAYSAAAEKLARTAFRSGNPHNPVDHAVSCPPSPACRTEFIQSFGFRAFRRPLDAAEVRRYEALFQKQPDFLAGAQLVAEAMLQSPNFLFHLEDAGEATNSKWRSYAAASRLSYALWDGTPDDALLAAAGRGADLDQDRARYVRVIEYQVPDRDGGGTAERIILITTITDFRRAPAPELARAYHERWEHEGGNAQLKTYLRGPGRVLRSQSPAMAEQEIWGYLLTHYAISALICAAATNAGIDPDRVKFKRTVRIIRRRAGDPAFSP